MLLEFFETLLLNNITRNEIEFQYYGNACVFSIYFLYPKKIKLNLIKLCKKDAWKMISRISLAQTK